jgi:hypothetical protein
MSELHPGLIAEDFEIGDRIYCLSNGVPTFGTVDEIDPSENYDSPWIFCYLDNQDELLVTWPFRGIGKVMPMEALKEGNILSCLDAGERVFYEVMDYPSGYATMLFPLDESKAVLTIPKDTSKRFLDMQFMDWELEG